MASRRLAPQTRTDACAGFSTLPSFGGARSRSNSSSAIFSIRRALTPSRSDTKLDNLMGVCSNRLSRGFRKRTLSRIDWRLRRVTVRHSRCSASGTKLKTSSCATSRLIIRSPSAKSFFRPRGPLALPARRLPVPLQRSPHRFPVRGGRFHDYFLDFLLDQPLGQHVQLIGGGAMPVFHGIPQALSNRPGGPPHWVVAAMPLRGAGQTTKNDRPPHSARIVS